MSHKVSSCEVLVAGGGIIGAACARALALRGLRVLICEPGPDPAAASAASAGILGPQIETTDESLRALGLRARDLYESLAVALADTTGIDIGCGATASRPWRSRRRRPSGCVTRSRTSVRRACDAIGSKRPRWRSASRRPRRALGRCSLRRTAPSTRPR